MTTLRSWILLVACGIGSLLLHLSPLEARQVVTEPGPRVQGVVTDQESGVALATGYVSLHRPDGEQVAQAFTDDQGRYILRAPGPGTFQARAERMGYQTATGPLLHLMPGDTIGVDFYLSMEAILLNPLVVTASARPLSDRYDMTGMAGFWQRYNRFSRSGYGEFLTRDTLAKYERSNSVGHILVWTTGSAWTPRPGRGSWWEPASWASASSSSS